MMLYPIPSPFPWLFLLLVAQSCPTLCNPMDCNMPGFPVLHYLLEKKIVSIDMTLSCPLSVNDATQSSHPLSPPSPPTLSLSQYQDLFQWVSSFHRLPKYWSFSFSISSSNEYSELISFRNDRFDLLAAHGTLKSLLQHHSSKVDVLFSIKQLLVHRCSPCPWLPSACWSFSSPWLSVAVFPPFTSGCFSPPSKFPV